MDIHDSTFHIVVDEVRVKLGLIFPLCQNHLDRDSRAEDTSLRVDRLQLYALQKAASGILELDQCISDLENGQGVGAGMGACGVCLTSHDVNLRNSSRA